MQANRFGLSGLSDAAAIDPSTVDQSTIDKLKSIAPTLLQKIQMMQDDAVRTGNPDAADMVSYGNDLKSVIESITGAIDWVSNTASSVWNSITHPFGIDLTNISWPSFGSDVVAASSLSGLRRRGLNGLGFLPLLPLVPVISIVTGAAAVTAITYYITQANRIHADIAAKEFAEVQAQADALRAKGDLAGAQAVLDKYNKVQSDQAMTASSETIAGTAKAIAGAAIVIAIAWYFIKRKK